MNNPKGGKPSIYATKTSVKNKRDRGLCLGNHGLGEIKVVRDGVTYIEPDNKEAQKIKRVKSWWAEGLTHKEILERCASEGVKTRRGTAPSIGTVRHWIYLKWRGARMSEDLKEDLCTLQRNTKGRDRRAYFAEALRLYGLTREDLELMIREDHEFYMGMVEAYFDSNYSELSDLPCINGHSWIMPG